LGTNGISDSAYGWVYDFQGMRHETAADYHATFTRVYSAPLGRFTSNDWIGFQGGDVNLYRFAGNNPANAVDPSGQAWWEWIPIISTIGHALADPKGIRPQDYQQSRSTAAECQVDAEYAFSLCQKRVYAQVSANLASWLGISTGIDFTKGLLGMVMGAVSAWAVKHGIRGAVGGVITGGVLAVDSVVDLAIVFNKAMRIKDAAEAAIQQYCPCQQQRAQAGKDLCTISESLS
jgi:RHS repeat-associated protein